MSSIPAHPGHQRAGSEARRAIPFYPVRPTRRSPRNNDSSSGDRLPRTQIHLRASHQALCAPSASLALGADQGLSSYGIHAICTRTHASSRHIACKRHSSAQHASLFKRDRNSHRLVQVCSTWSACERGCWAHRSQDRGLAGLTSPWLFTAPIATLKVPSAICRSGWQGASACFFTRHVLPRFFHPARSAAARVKRIST